MSIQPYAYTRKAHFYETDQMGIVHHSNYIRWFEETRIDFMEKIGYSYVKTSDTGIDILVLSVQCEYKSMVKYGDTVDIYAVISEMTPTRMTISYKVVDKFTEVIRSIGQSEHCFYSRDKQRPISLKKELPELYNIFDANK